MTRNRIQEEWNAVKAGQISAVVLAGGYSTRMGRDKASLALNGRTFLEIQVDKLRALGVADVMVSGAGYRAAGARTVADIYPHRGPLGGVHACLLSAAHPACLVVSTDVPLIPTEALMELVQAHVGGVTALCHGDRVEPLMAVYDCALAGEAERLLNSGNTSMMQLLRRAPLTRYAYRMDEFLLTNCNTPEDYARILACGEGKP